MTADASGGLEFRPPLAYRQRDLIRTMNCQHRNGNCIHRGLGDFMADSAICSVTLGSRARSIRPTCSSADSNEPVTSGKRVSAIQNRFGSSASLSRCAHSVRFSLGCGHWSARSADLVPEPEVASCLRWVSLKSGRRAARANRYRGSCCAVISLDRPVSLSPRERRSPGTLSTGRVTTLASDWQIHRFPNEFQTKAIQIRGLATASVMRLAANPATIVSIRTPRRRYLHGGRWRACSLPHPRRTSSLTK
jgi:hypothetical protein